MIKTGLAIRSAYLKTNEKLSDRFLFCGNLKSESQNSFFFYLIEILSPWLPSSKVKDTILEILEKAVMPSSEILDDFFENLVLVINESLAKMTKKGEKDWFGNLNAVIGVVDNDRIIITQTGNIAGYIFRKGKISSITAKSSLGSPTTAFVDVTSGKISLDDRIILGNTELYNHFSIDYLRQISEKRPAKVAILELFKSLRRIRELGANAIIIEVSDQTKIAAEPPSDMPDEVFLDQTEESFAILAQKKLSPHLIKLSDQARLLYQKTTKQGKGVLAAANKNWQQKYGPETKKLLTKSYNKVSTYIGTLQKNDQPDEKDFEGLKKDELRPKIKVKTVSYSKHENKGRIKSLQPVVREIFGLMLEIIKPKNRKFFYVLLILLFLSGGYLKIKANNTDNTRKTEAEQNANLYDNASNIYQKAKADLASGSAEAADELNAALSQAKTASDNGPNIEKAEQLESEIQVTLDGLTKTRRFSNPTPIFTFSDSVKEITVTGSEIYGITGGGKIFAADTRGQEPNLVASIGKDNGIPVSLTYSKTPDKIFIYTNQKKVLTYDIASKTYSDIKIVDDSGKWEDAKSIASFVSNIYLLDSEAGEIWKHMERTGGYSRGSAYLNTTTASIRNAVDLAVDGDFYILQSDASVTKFSKSLPVPVFSLKPAPAPNQKIRQPAQIVTDADSANLFILDKEQNRILNYSKTGDFIGQYAFDGITIEKMVLNSKIQKFWVLSSNKVYEINI